MVQWHAKQQHTSEPYRKSINKVIFDATLFKDFMSSVYNTYNHAWALCIFNILLGGNSSIVGGMVGGFCQACCGCCSVAHLAVAPVLIISGKQVSGPPTGNAFHYLDFVSSSSILWICFLLRFHLPGILIFTIHGQSSGDEFSALRPTGLGVQFQLLVPGLGKTLLP